MVNEQPAVVRWSEGGTEHEARWRSESLPAPPSPKIHVADDRTTADTALRLIRQGHFVLYRGGDYVNARQLLAALGRRVEKKRSRDGGAASSPAETFRRERDKRAEEHRLLTRVLVPLDADYKVALRRGIDLRSACEPVWGPSEGKQTVAPLRELLGMAGAAQWREKGVEVKGLPGKLHPHYGVFAPTRGEYPELLKLGPSPLGKRVFDIGTGTGVLGFLLLAKGAKEVVATDVDPRAVACARENAERLGYADRFTVHQTDLFPPETVTGAGPEGRADIVISNPPWLPEKPRTPTDRAVYDPDGAFLRGLLAGVRGRLNEGGECWIILSDLAERLGLRREGEFEAMVREAGLEVKWTKEVRPQHKKATDPDDPLHAARSEEIVRLWSVA